MENDNKIEPGSPLTEEQNARFEKMRKLLTYHEVDEVVFVELDLTKAFKDYQLEENKQDCDGFWYTLTRFLKACANQNYIYLDPGDTVFALVREIRRAGENTLIYTRLMDSNRTVRLRLMNCKNRRMSSYHKFADGSEVVAPSTNWAIVITQDKPAT